MLSKAEALGEVVGKFPLLSQGPIRAVRAECCCGVSGEGWERGKVRTGEENPQEESEKGNEGYPQFPDLTHMSRSCRVSHGIAGTLLGEMALCAKKRPPGKTGRRRGRGESLGPSRVGVIMTKGAKEEGRQVMSLKEGRLQPLSILGGALGNRILRLDSLSWVLPQEGAECLPLTPKHIDSYLGAPGAPILWSGEPGVLCSHHLLSVLALRFLPSFSHPRPGPPCFPEGGGGGGRRWDESGCPGQRWQSPHPHWPGRGRRDSVLAFAYAARWQAATPAVGGAGGGGAQGVQVVSGATQSALASAGDIGGGGGAAERAASLGAGGREDGRGCRWGAHHTAGAPL